MIQQRKKQGYDNDRHRYPTSIPTPTASDVLRVVLKKCSNIHRSDLKNISIDEIIIKSWNARNCYFNLRGESFYANLSKGNESLFVFRT